MRVGGLARVAPRIAPGIRCHPAWPDRKQQPEVAGPPVPEVAPEPVPRQVGTAVVHGLSPGRGRAPIVGEAPIMLLFSHTPVGSRHDTSTCARNGATPLYPLK